MVRFCSYVLIFSPIEDFQIFYKKAFILDMIIVLKIVKHAFDMQKQPSEMFSEKKSTENLANLTGKHLHRNPFLIKLQTSGLQLY